MNTDANRRYMLIFRGTDWYQGLSPEQMQQVADQWMSWFNGLRESGTATAGDPLEPVGKVVSGSHGRTVTDGPFSEAKESIGGYFLLEVESMEEAVAIARECPGLPYGIRVEVRPLAGACAMVDKVRKERELVAA
jgi:hypothetical protein